MIALVSCLLAAYESIARRTGRRTVSELSTDPEWGPFIWGWLFALAIHFAYERSSWERRRHP